MEDIKESKEPPKPLSDQEIKELQSKIIHETMERGESFEEAKDVAQEVILKFIKNGKGQYVFHAVIDELRKKYGRDFSKKGMFTELAEQQGATHPDFSYLDFENVLSHLKKDEAILIRLITLIGLNNRECALVFNVTKSRISQILKRITYQLNHRKAATRVHASWQEQFLSKTKAEGDHILWGGHWNDGVPKFTASKRFGKISGSARQIYYLLLKGERVKGTLKPKCGNMKCIKREHMEVERYESRLKRRRSFTDAQSG